MPRAKVTQQNNREFDSVRVTRIEKAEDWVLKLGNIALLPARIEPSLPRSASKTPHVPYTTGNQRQKKNSMHILAARYDPTAELQ